MIKPKLCLMSIVMCIAMNCISDIEDIYKFDMSLKVPRVYNNSESLGYRKISQQRLSGLLHIIYSNDNLPYIYVSDLVNMSYKTTSGAKITYECEKNDDKFDRLYYIGDNRSNKFSTPALNTSIIAEPSYALSEMNEDNSLYIDLAGYGKSSKYLIKQCQVISTMSGYVTGTLGCGCSDYGHVSPTRVVGPYTFEDLVVDVAPVYGTWKIKFKQRR